MRAIVQRVTEAKVQVGEETTGEIKSGLLVFLGVGVEDKESDATYLADKILGLRVFEDDDGKMNLSVTEVAGEVLAVSQFTLFGDCRKGRRPSFVAAAPPVEAERLYELFVASVRNQGVSVACGRFRAHMDVSLVNDGPVTLMLDSTKQF